ncbi:MAG: antitoxin Xre/MbcA/ParS toxin-binding domain-containing protein [Bacteroidota bacterium]
MSTARKIISSTSSRQNDDKRAFKLIRLVRDGIPFHDFSYIAAAHPFDTKEWGAFLNTTVRTLDRYKEGNKKLTQKQTERVIEIQQLMEYGITVFEDNQNFYAWLNSKNVALGGFVPKQLFDTTIGINLVKDELGKIEHGLLA